MPLFDETHVKIENCIVVYDRMNRPEEPNSNGNIKRGLKVVVNPNNPDIGVLQQLATNELHRSEFKGVLPQGGTMPIGTAGDAEFNGMYPGWAVVNCSTFKMPDVYDESGRALTDPMQYLGMVYPGQVVDVLVNCSAFNNVSKGVASRLDGFLIKASANAPRQNFGSGGIDTSGAFGGNQNQNQNQGQPQQQYGGQPNNQNQGQQQQQYGNQPNNQNQNQGQPQQQYGGQPNNQNQNQGQPQQQYGGQPNNQNQNQGQPQQQYGNQPNNQNQNQGQPQQQYGNQPNNQNQGPEQAHNYLPNNNNNG